MDGAAQLRGGADNTLRRCSCAARRAVRGAVWWNLALDSLRFTSRYRYGLQPDSVETRESETECGLSRGAASASECELRLTLQCNKTKPSPLTRMHERRDGVPIYQ